MNFIKTIHPRAKAAGLSLTSDFVKPTCHFKTKWGEESMRSGFCATIYRNDKSFGRRFGFDLNSTFIEASHFLSKLIGHPVPFHYRNFKEELVGRKVYYDNQPAIIEQVSFDNGGDYPLKLVPDKDKIKQFSPQGHWTEEKEDCLHWEYGDSSWTEILDPKIWWFRD